MRKIPILLLLTGCQFSDQVDDGAHVDPAALYMEMIAALDREHPGRGMDIFDQKEKDRPMAYALILSSEAMRYNSTGEPDALDLVRTCGHWLLENADLNSNGIHGFGLADAWDAFQDSTMNPAHLEYTITTALAIKGLIDWLATGADPQLNDRISGTIWNCFLPYVHGTCDSPIGIPAYSLALHDMKYDVYNPAAFLAGQMQRFSAITDDARESALLQDRSRTIMDIVLAHHSTDANGDVYWEYGVQPIMQRPNDLVHACYIIEGIRDHIDHGGTSDVLSISISDHLFRFRSKHVWYEHPVKDLQHRNYNSRLWGLGMLLYSLSREGHDEEVAALLRQIGSYYKGNGSFKFKENDDRSMIRQEAHLLLGLSHHLFGDAIGKDELEHRSEAHALPAE